MTVRPLHLAAGSALDVNAATLVRAAGAAGFDGVGLRLTGEHALTGPQVADLSRLLNSEGVYLAEVEVVRIGGPSLNVAALFDTAAALSAQQVLVVSDLPDEAATADALAHLVEQARCVGLGVGLEYMAWTTPATPTRAAAMASACGATVVCDVLHHHRVGATPQEVSMLADRGVLGWVQICDAPRSAPQGGTQAWLNEARHHRLPPGDGELDGIELMAHVPPHVPLSVEVQSDAMSATGDLAGRMSTLHAAAQRWNTIGYRPK
jgi:sugar phosphate isomerase/epimerase